MAKRKLESTPGMHPNNPYCNNNPDFAALAEQYPSLKPYVTITTIGSKPRGSINFKDPLALRQLTYCLLRKDFSIELDIPIDSLCPAVPNRVNYICWIEDLMKSETERAIHGIDVSIEFASRNVSRNGLKQTIRIVKNASLKIFPDSLFPDNETRYDFCICNPPFYEDELDIQESLDGKKNQPQALCQGTSNEMITRGGELQFVKQMVDESRQWRHRIRWYTSMLGKKSSIDGIVSYLKTNKILNYTLTTFHQGRTARWAIGWSFGDEHASWTAMKQASNKLLKLTPAATTLSFTSVVTTAEEALDRVRSILDQSSIEYELSERTSSSSTDPIRVLHGQARANTWSRAARRALERAAKEKGESSCNTRAELDPAPTIMGFDLYIMHDWGHEANTSPSTEASASSTAKSSETNGLRIQLRWTVGYDRALFESFFLHVRNRYLSGPALPGS
ncbi:Methyltransferase-like protein 16 [Mortierella claussenii]|nr:Methyltransferase-like protein 16 [Mortierella claussenii]